LKNKVLEWSIIKKKSIIYKLLIIMSNFGFHPMQLKTGAGMPPPGMSYSSNSAQTGNLGFSLNTSPNGSFGAVGVPISTLNPNVNAGIGASTSFGHRGPPSQSIGASFRFNF